MKQKYDEDMMSNATARDSRPYHNSQNLKQSQQRSQSQVSYQMNAPSINVVPPPQDLVPVLQSQRLDDATPYNMSYQQQQQSTD